MTYWYLFFKCTYEYWWIHIELKQKKIQLKTVLYVQIKFYYGGYKTLFKGICICICKIVDRQIKNISSISLFWLFTTSDKPSPPNKHSWLRRSWPNFLVILRWFRHKEMQAFLDGGRIWRNYDLFPSISFIDHSLAELSRIQVKKIGGKSHLRRTFVNRLWPAPNNWLHNSH